jgi:hypothetical protein
MFSLPGLSDHRQILDHFIFVRLSHVTIPIRPLPVTLAITWRCRTNLPQDLTHHVVDIAANLFSIRDDLSLEGSPISPA